MEIAFDSKPLRAICEHEWVARDELGDYTAELLMHRLADIHAAVSITDLVVGSVSVTTWDERDVILVELGHDRRLVLAANHPTNPVTGSGGVDWSRVRRLKVLHIGEGPS